ncbi:hypothetical protein, partial [Neobacillus paridis]|uniref:hypothetical protein n=1 Tax=Neobacillus paridis TaxID=2803862 RepID=UPI001F337443
NTAFARSILHALSFISDAPFWSWTPCTSTLAFQCRFREDASIPLKPIEALLLIFADHKARQCCNRAVALDHLPRLADGMFDQFLIQRNRAF